MEDEKCFLGKWTVRQDAMRERGNCLTQNMRRRLTAATESATPRGLERGGWSCNRLSPAASAVCPMPAVCFSTLLWKVCAGNPLLWPPSPPPCPMPPHPTSKTSFSDADSQGQEHRSLTAHFSPSHYKVSSESGRRSSLLVHP